jgi:hypothetical protein
MTELEAATSSFVLDDATVMDLTSPTSSPLTRSRQASNNIAVAQDPVLASYTSDDDVNPFDVGYFPSC